MALTEAHWYPEAILDAERARNWYAERSPFAARGFLLAVDVAVTAVVKAPRRWPERKFGCRHYILPSRYPYTLIYRLDPGVTIVAIAHQRQRPDYWSRRRR